MKAWTLVECLFLGLGLAACANLERSRTLGNPEVPAKTLALQVCSNCHGVDGNAESPNFPKLAGQTEDYFVLQMTDFRGHSRSDPAGFEYMWGLSRHLTDRQIKGLAGYYAAQAPHQAVPGLSGERFESGKAIFERGVAEQNVTACLTCHGDHGQGNAQFPRIAGQHADYLIKQLMVFQRTDQRPEGSVMKTVAHGLTRQNMEDVAEFLQAQ